MSRLSERIENFNRAFGLYEQAHSEYVLDKQNKITQLALVQAFEIVFELGWKCLKDYLNNKDIKAFTPRDVIKSAFSAEILPNAQVWIDMAKDRNISSHEYNEKKVEAIIERVGTVYFDEISSFNSWLGAFNE